MKKHSSSKLLAGKHTAKLRHHKHTSYVSLLLILLVATVPVFSASGAVAAAANMAADPVNGSEGVYGVVAGPVPKTAPTIQGVPNGRVFTTSDPVRIAGNCPIGTLVKLFKNEVFAGGVLCQNGTYQLNIDLFIGSNALVARAYNTNDVASPDSTPVTVQLVAPTTNGSAGSSNAPQTSANQFFITSELSYRGTQVGETMTWPLILSGGQQPYAVSIYWGDGKTQLISRQNPGRFDISHAYKQPGGYRGSYNIVVKASDAAGSQSFIQLTSIVSGKKNPAGIAGSVSGGYHGSTMVRVAWQLLAASLLGVLAFWLGEKRELRLAHRKGMRSA